jgi:hypothetical protein
MNGKTSNDNRQVAERVIASGDLLTIETIAAFVQQIREGLAEADAVVIEFQQDIVLDITALQAFCSACRAATAAGKKFGFRGPLPETLVQFAMTAGSERHESCANNNMSCFRQFGGSR